ncbi:MAG: putative AlkP superfamily pyrophosphatase or phosphodiesterase [Bradymonadia bacterium]|jgi:predicted AlkP superfamily pyrophosphatase or phosphodiesterase
MKNLLVVNIVGLTPELLAYTPRIAAVAKGGFQATLSPSLPAVTTTSQSTMLTGRMPRDHGAVANGWYFRDLAEVWLWRQSNHLVQGPKVWDAARERFGETFTVAKMFWWYNMYADVNWSVTPRPVYPADGRKLPSIYAEPPTLKARLQDALGTFPLFNFWGPTADIKSSAWIAKATRQVIIDHAPSLALCYLPHLDYELQRKGPRGPHAEAAAAEIDAVAGDLIDDARGRGYEILVVSEYGIEAVESGVHINRALRDAGLLRANLVDTGWELLDFGASAAFAVADHQVAHVYVKDPRNISKVKALLEGLDGVDRVLDAEGKAAAGLDHGRSGELVAIAKAGRWFTYYYWLDDAVRPDFANCVDIHRKPGYDPVELFVDPALAAPKLKVAWTLLKKMAGFRYYMNVIPLDDTLVKGSHGRLPSTRAQGPLVISSQTIGAADHLPMTAIHDLILDSMA